MQGQTDKRIRLLIICISIVILLSIGLYQSNSALIFCSLFLFAFFLVLSDYKFLLPLLLFFLPWSPVLKINPSSFTFFTLVIPIVFVLMLFKNRKLRISNSIIIMLLFFVAYTLIVKLVNNLPVEYSYLYFIFLLFFIPFYIQNFWEKLNFETCVLFMTTGIISSCIASNLLMDIPHMGVYINVYARESVGLTRLSGFYGDPNFYSAQIIMAIASLLVVLTRTKKKSVMLLELISIITLVYFGLLSISKMFLLSLILIIFIWGISFIIEKSNFIYKLGVIFSILVLVGFIIATNIFSTQIDQYIFRFTNSEFTTGRTILQKAYLDYLLSNTDTLIVGVGFTNIMVNSHAAHNTFIQIVWQIGLIGGIFLLLWQRIAFAPMVSKGNLKPAQSLLYILLLSVYFLPWVALDFLYFDEFFYYMLLMFLGKNYIKFD